MGTKHFTTEHKESLRLAQPHRIIPPKKELLIDLYLRQKKSTREMADILHRNQANIMRWLKLYEIPRRTYKENKMPVRKGGTHKWGDKISKSVTGKRNGRYVDGSSYIPLRKRYPRAFNWRLKEKIKQRDNFVCQRCGITEKEHIKKTGRKLSVNHINFDKKDIREKNLNTLCVSCNTIVNSNRSYWTKVFQGKLTKTYGKINNSNLRSLRKEV